LAQANLTSDFIKRSALAAGFDLAGIASVIEHEGGGPKGEWV
jgi:hypothetical protein